MYAGGADAYNHLSESDTDRLVAALQVEGRDPRAAGKAKMAAAPPIRARVRGHSLPWVSAEKKKPPRGPPAPSALRAAPVGRSVGAGEKSEPRAPASAALLLGCSECAGVVGCRVAVYWRCGPVAG